MEEPGKPSPRGPGLTPDEGGIAALHFSDAASDLEGANPLAPPTFLGEKTVRRLIRSS